MLFKSWGASLTSTSYTHSIDTLLQLSLQTLGVWTGRSYISFAQAVGVFLLVLLISLFGMWGKSLAQNIEMANSFLDFEWYQDARFLRATWQYDPCFFCVHTHICNGFSLALKWRMFHYFSKVGWDGECRRNCMLPQPYLQITQPSGISWTNPPPSSSHRQDYCILSRESLYT